MSSHTLTMNLYKININKSCCFKKKKWNQCIFQLIFVSSEDEHFWQRECHVIQFKSNVTFCTCSFCWNVLPARWFLAASSGSLTLPLFLLPSHLWMTFRHSIVPGSVCATDSRLRGAETSANLKPKTHPELRSVSRTTRKRGLFSVREAGGRNETPALEPQTPV